MKSPQLVIHRKLQSFANDIKMIKKKFIPRVMFSEFEAQPWGDGESWIAQIDKNPMLVAKTASQLKTDFAKFVPPKSFDIVTLWGAEFWLIAYHLGHTEMLHAVEGLG